MDFEKIAYLVQTLGFPIVLVFLFCWFIYKIWLQSAKRETKLYEEINECRKINAQAIDTLSQYVERLETIQRDVQTIKDDIIVLTSKIE
jgi:F0F1-type ATP synthase membrane subunit b/b'